MRSDAYITDEVNDHHMPTGCTHGAPTYQAVRQYPPFVVLSQFQQSFVDIHLRYYLLSVFTEYSLQ